MKSRIFIACSVLILVAEIVALIVFAMQTPDFSQDAVDVNEVMQSVTQDFTSLSSHKKTTGLDYVVLDVDGRVLYKTRSGLSESINAAITHRDTILDISIDGAVAGKVIIGNDGARSLGAQKLTVITVVSVAIAVQCAILIGYAVYMYLRLIKPFRKLKGFSERIACGNLDIPLEMDKLNVFGAFTESFDVMRNELKKARLAEAQAQQSKKELVAKLSHDIKTPIASIKAVSEVGLAVTKNAPDRENYTQIIGKADQINTLVTNLFTATLEELQQLTVTPTRIDGAKVQAMLQSADYMHRAEIPTLPKCSVHADALRLQQVFDNIFANSYKYANTDISVETQIDSNRIRIAIEDCGGGVCADELPVLKEKYRRGGNSGGTEGAGLGLYISDYFMKEMNGELILENGAHGLRVTVALSLTGNN